MTSAEEYLAERCRVTHAAIKEGNTMIVSFGVMRFPGKPLMYLYLCPHCGTTVSHRKKSVDLDTRQEVK